jgi:hypothetical protein
MTKQDSIRHWRTYESESNGATVTTSNLSVDFTRRETQWWRAALSAAVTDEESRRAFRLLIESLRRRQCHYLIKELPYDRAKQSLTRSRS